MKIYQTKTQADYDALMVKLEGEGCVWLSGISATRSRFDVHGERTCVNVKDGRMEFSYLGYYIRNYPEIPIIPFTAADNVNHPPHYKQGNQETIDIIEDLVKAYPRKIGYHIGNTIKYIC